MKFPFQTCGEFGGEKKEWTGRKNKKDEGGGDKEAKPE